ncbi:hypothetical protein BGZ81_002764 [Podila clonocystis]|nr:hypothetical protein BGZ81_002764 [Podila clonocystis]
MKTTINSFLESYTTPDAFDSIAGFAERFNLHKVAAQFTDSFLDEQGIGKLYREEIVEVATRVNYGSNLNEIHALGALVTMAADDGLQIKGGNFQIFEGMVGKSQANVRLNTKIARVRKLQPKYEGADPRFEVITTTGQKEVFDHIVIAAPIQSTNIDFDLDLPSLPKVNYRTIHVTFVHGHVNPDYFHAASVEKFPTHILTTNSNAEFTSVSIQAKLSNGETVTKIFSPKAVKEDLLDRLYTNRTWVKRKEWKAYPELAPIPELDPSLEAKPLTASEIHQFVLKQHLRKQEDEAQKAAKAAWGQVEVVPGVFYVNAFEPLISTMETETIAGKNVARLLRNKILGYCPAEKCKTRD